MSADNSQIWKFLCQKERAAFIFGNNTKYPKYQDEQEDYRDEFERYILEDGFAGTTKAPGIKNCLFRPCIIVAASIIFVLVIGV
ncbi:MAG: hypothetical protein FWB94_06135 [Chitinispirillia bacterium]|nr:hypothetical protein [Chitinispirillia bacterium]